MPPECVQQILRQEDPQELCQVQVGRLNGTSNAKKSSHPPTKLVALRMSIVTRRTRICPVPPMVKTASWAIAPQRTEPLSDSVSAMKSLGCVCPVWYLLHKRVFST